MLYEQGETVQDCGTGRMKRYKDMARAGSGGIRLWYEQGEAVLNCGTGSSTQYGIVVERSMNKNVRYKNVARAGTRVWHELMCS